MTQAADTFVLDDMPWTRSWVGGNDGREEWTAAGGRLAAYASGYWRPKPDAALARHYKARLDGRESSRTFASLIEAMHAAAAAMRKGG